MNRSIIVVAGLCVLLYCAHAGAAAWDTVVFRDDFDAPVGGMPDPDVWVVNNPGNWWRTQGRTHFPDPLSTTGPFPRIEEEAGDRFCVIEHHLYNPWDLGDPNTWFLGGEIHTLQEFEPTRAYRFEARVRSHPFPNGLVTSFFDYGFDGAESDEIDFEFVSNKTNDDVTYPNGDPVLTNTYNESSQKPQYVAPAGLDLTAWNTFRIYWFPSLHRIDWTWVDPINGETLLRTESDAFFVPDEPMALYFNFWAPCYTSWVHECGAWDDAADANLQPVNGPGQNEIHRYEIDHVEVRVQSEPAPALSSWSLLATAVLIVVTGGLLISRRRIEARFARR
jgi:hypothetical protein